MRQHLTDASAGTDTVEVKVRSTVKSKAGSQTVDIHFVRKGFTKMILELKSPMLNQRSILSGNRIQITNLTTQQVQILPYKGNEIPWESTQVPNPLDTGSWSEPVAISDSVYELNSLGTRVLYNANLERLVEITQAVDQGGQVVITMDYDSQTKNPKVIQTNVSMGGYSTIMKMDFILIRPEFKK